MDVVALDTNIAIDILNGNPSIIKNLEKVKIICLPVIVVGELLYGARNSRRSSKNLDVYQSFVQACQVLSVDHEVAEKYSLIRKSLKSKGRPNPENDIWIAAISRVNQIALVTRDQHFGYVEDLRLFSF